MNKNFKSIDFIGIGVEKAGTTWLAKMLSQHPQIFMPKEKELHYFNKEETNRPWIYNFSHDKDVSWYLNFFRKAQPGMKLGEISPSYYWSKNAAFDIYKFNPKIKLFVILRNPVDNVYSRYLYFKQRGAIKNEPLEDSIINFPWNVDRCFYSKHIKKFIDLFPKENFKIYIYEEIFKNKYFFLEDLEKFIGVEVYIPKNVDVKINETGEPVLPFLNPMIHVIRNYVRANNMKFVLSLISLFRLNRLYVNLLSINCKKFKNKPIITEEQRKMLYDIFKDDILELEKMLGRDLSLWKI